MRPHSLTPLLAVAAAFLLGSTPALAAGPPSVTADFDTYVLGDVNGQQGWFAFTNSPTAGTVVADPAGGQMVALTHLPVFAGVASGLNSPLIDGAGESGVLNGAQDAAGKNHFTATLEYVTPAQATYGATFVELNPSFRNPPDQTAQRYARAAVSDVIGVAGVPTLFSSYPGANNTFPVAGTVPLDWATRYTLEYDLRLFDGLAADGGPNDTFCITVRNADGSMRGTIPAFSWEVGYSSGSFGGGTGPRLVNGLDFLARFTLPNAVTPVHERGWIDDVSIQSGTVPAGVLPPTNATAGAIGRTVTVSFTAPDVDDCTVITSYTVTDNQGNTATLPAGTTSATFNNVLPGSHTFTITVNYAGGATAMIAAPPVAVVADPTIATQASPSDVQLGAGFADLATVTGVAGGPVPTGTVTFALYGPTDPGFPTCAGAPFATSAPIALTPAGPTSATAGSGTFGVAPLAPIGNYTFVATYSGDANYTGQTTSCNDIAERVSVEAAPTIDVDSTVAPSSLPAPGGSVTYNVVITNTGTKPVTIATLTNDVHGNVGTKGTCTSAVGTVLAAGGSYTCTFTANFTGIEGTTQTDVLTATATDDDGSVATDTDDATVTLTAAPTTTTSTTTTTVPATTSTTAAPTTTAASPTTMAPALASNAPTASPGGSVTLTATNLCPNSTATFVQSGPGGNVTLGTAPTDTAGNASLVATAPSNAGTYTVTASTSSGGCVLAASLGLTVTEPIITAPGELPGTGAAPGGTVALASALVLAGLVALVGVSRRRRV